MSANRSVVENSVAVGNSSIVKEGAVDKDTSRYMSTMRTLSSFYNSTPRGRKVGLVAKLNNGEQVVRYGGVEMLLSEAREKAGCSWVSDCKRITQIDVDHGIEVVLKYPNVQLPVYQTSTAVAFDICAAEDTVIPSIFDGGGVTLVHTGLNVTFGDDEAFWLIARSSTPKRGLMLANGVGIFESDYYQCDSNDGEILVAFFNLTKEPVEIKAGERIAQGMFTDIRRADNLEMLKVERKGGLGSTGK